MLINLSNHPFPEWSERQKKEAWRLFGEVEDWHFPPIDPESTASEIEKLAEDYFQMLAVRIASIPDVAIHLMGEMTFSFALLKKLQESKIDCYASTANRNVNILASGEKVVRFDFVKFRKYG